MLYIQTYIQNGVSAVQKSKYQTLLTRAVQNRDNHRDIEYMTAGKECCRVAASRTKGEYLRDDNNVLELNRGDLQHCDYT